MCPVGQEARPVALLSSRVGMDPRSPVPTFDAAAALRRVQALADAVPRGEAHRPVAAYLLSSLARRLGLRVVVLDRQVADISAVRRHLAEALRGIERLAQDGWGWVEADITVAEFAQEAEAVLQRADDVREQAELAELPSHLSQ